MTRFRNFILPALALVFAAACQDTPTQPSVDEAPLLKGGPPSSCGDMVPLAITVGGALTDDGGGAYVEGNEGAHLNGPTGNLMLWTSQYGSSSRYVDVNWTGGVYPTTDRIYTNNHDNDSGNNACGFKGMANGTAGTAALEIELDNFAIVRYGKACDGSLEAVADRPVTSRSADGSTWTLSGDNGLVCQQEGRGKNATWVTLGTAGPVSLSMVAQ